MQSIHGLMVHKATNATIVQNDVIMGRCIKSMNMIMDAQYDFVIMQLMVGNVIIMYEYAIKKDNNNFAKEMHKLVYMDDMEIDATRQS